MWCGFMGKYIGLYYGLFVALKRELILVQLHAKVILKLHTQAL